MIQHLRLRAVVAAALCLAPFAASCASQQYQAALDEREAENRTLREERAQLKGQLRDAQYQNESLEAALADANARLIATPDTQGTPKDQELEDLGVTTGIRDGNVVYTVQNEITFASGKAELSQNGKKALSAVADRLKRDYPQGVYWIEGHTDNDPIVKSKFASNRDLSIARSMAVLHYLVDDAGIKDGQCFAGGWGPNRPVASNDNAADKARNRRVEIIVRQ